MLNAYKQLKVFEGKYDAVIDPGCADISFCVRFLIETLLLIKYQPSLFNDHIDSSEWDYVVKFWGVVTEDLFHNSSLRLKW
jgi:hypothetical protein